MRIPVRVEFLPKRCKSKREKELLILSHITLTDFRTFKPHLTQPDSDGYAHFGNKYGGLVASYIRNNSKELSSDGQMGIYFSRRNGGG